MKHQTKTDLVLAAIIVVFAVVILLAAQTEKAQAQDCIPLPTGECLTLEMYDEWFSYANLTQTPLHIDPTITVAEAYDIQPDIASQRERSFMGVDLPTFAELWETHSWPE